MILILELNKIYNMDCLEGLKQLGDNSIDLVVTDPPYLHVKGGMKSKKFNTGTWKTESEMVTKLSDFGEKSIYEFLDVSIPKMKKINMYIFCSKLQLQYYFSYIKEHKLKYDLLVWDKVKYAMKSTKFFTGDIEYVVRIYQSGVSLRKILIEDKSKADINYYLKRQSYEQPRGKHETGKPIDLIKKYIELSSDVGDTVCDPFIGSGTTAIACLSTNRNYIGFEIEEKHYNIANQRINNYLLGYPE